MYLRQKLVLILMVIGTTQGSDGNVSLTSIRSSKKACDNKSIEELNGCWKNLVPFNSHGIPSSLEKIEQTCVVFTSSMECIENWSRNCLSKAGQEKIENSVIGAVQLYSSLCNDNSFREDYLKHVNCYLRISQYWDACNTKFSNTLKRIDHASDTLSLCCVRLKYSECISNVTTALCSDVAKQFLQSITESLMHSTIQQYHSSQCVNVTQETCSSSSSTVSVPKFFKKYPFPIFIMMLSTFKELLIRI